MKKLIIALGIVVLSFSFFTSNALAHPGRTDSSGGHTCRTNCPKWGYTTGEYHYHNGGGSTSSTTTGSTNVSSPSPKPAYTQADVNNGRESGESLGFDDGYNRGTKNANTTIGNEGYKKGYAAGYEAGYNDGLKKIKEEDTLAGGTLGESEGKVAYQNGENKEVTTETSKSDSWNGAYQSAFIRSFNREKVIADTGKAGNDLGYSLAKLEVPSDYSKDATLEKAFESHYKIGYEKRISVEKDKSLKLGSKDGYALATLAIASLDNRFKDSYKQGYEEGKLKRKEEILAEGYQSAFVDMKYEETGTYDNSELIEWYREGFESNEIADEIKETAFENGRSNSEYTIPEEYKINDQSIALYDSLFQEGQELRAEEQQKKMMYAAGIGIPTAGLAVGGFFFRKRKKKKIII